MNENLMSEEKEISLNKISMITNELLFLENNIQNEYFALYKPYTSDLLISYLSEIFNLAILSN
ncbi:MAG: hypothetical protein ACW981_00980 [Candidatus Hodarchaeales archaeon]|jgi:hypothetical protein